MNRDEALDLIPLAAAGDLDAATTAAVLAAIDQDPVAREELRAFEALDARLRAALAPEDDALPTWLAPSPAPPVVKRHCPYCKDDLGQGERVLCASCLTPHHQGCFSENRGCSLLGCGSTRCIAASDPASAVCATCGEQSPAAAPFCAWCGTARSGAAAPLHEHPRAARPASAGWARLAAAAAVLLAGGLGSGWLFGLQYGRGLVRSAHQRAEARLDAAERGAQDALRAVVAAQRLVRGQRDAAGRAIGYAPSFEALLARLGSTEEERRLRARLSAPGYTITVAKAEPSTSSLFRLHYTQDAFLAVARPSVGSNPGHPAFPEAPCAYFTNHRGEIEVLVDRWERQTRAIDPVECILKEKP